MRRVVESAFLAALGACYAPSATDGAPCGPGGACPTGLTCDLDSRCVRVPARPVDGGQDALVDAASTDFIDDFARPDAADLGNGWIEKAPTVFSVSGGEVVRIDTPTQSYRDNMVYRPASEDLLDVETSVRVRFVQTPPRYPQIFVRARSATIATADFYDGYLLYVEGSTATDKIVLGRQLGNVFVVALATITLSSPINTTDPFRFTLRATGTSPVTLTATIERFSGAWSVIGSTTVDDSASNRIQDAGTVGFAGDEIAAYVYDDFRRSAL